jgi:hypothetical protein
MQCVLGRTRSHSTRHSEWGSKMRKRTLVLLMTTILLSVVGTASAAHAFSFGFRGPSVRTETAQKDPMFHT